MMYICFDINIIVVTIFRNFKMVMLFYTFNADLFDIIDIYFLVIIAKIDCAILKQQLSIFSNLQIFAKKI